MSELQIPPPTDLKLHRRSRELEVRFADGLNARLTAEFLRVHSPSAEVKGHSAGEGLLVTGKEAVNIASIEPVGRYAVRLVFDDGHNTGLYTWPLLYELCAEHDRKWARYLERLARSRASRAIPSRSGPNSQRARCGRFANALAAARVRPRTRAHRARGRSRCSPGSTATSDSRRPALGSAIFSMTVSERARAPPRRPRRRNARAPNCRPGAGGRPLWWRANRIDAGRRPGDRCCAYAYARFAMPTELIGGSVICSARPQLAQRFLAAAQHGLRVRQPNVQHAIVGIQAHGFHETPRPRRPRRARRRGRGRAPSAPRRPRVERDDLALLANVASEVEVAEKRLEIRYAPHASRGGARRLLVGAQGFRPAPAVLVQIAEREVGEPDIAVEPQRLARGRADAALELVHADGSAASLAERVINASASSSRFSGVRQVRSRGRDAWLRRGTPSDRSSLVMRGRCARASRPS